MLYDQILWENQLTDSDIHIIYASGMVTSPYGIREIPHQILPLSVQQFAEQIYCHFEEQFFCRNLYLIPGLKTIDPDDFSSAGNMRGEEIEVIGALDELRSREIHCAAVLTPGSHSHITYVKENHIQDILSTFTGELFHALKTETLLSPILSTQAQELDASMVHTALENLKKFGFNRALYLCHAMRMMGEGSETQRFSYAEGVINGGVREALDYYCAHCWKDCHTLAIVSNAFLYQLFSILFEDSPYIKQILWLPISDTQSYAVKGLKTLIQLRRNL